MLDVNTIILAFMSGLIPAIFWLWFWVREDNRSPEPRRLLILTFVCGMIAVPLVVPIQKIAYDIFNGSTSMFIVWAITEEILKYGAALVAVLMKKENDEPLDPVIYMIAAALGFSALENALFVLNPFMNNDFAAAAVTGNLRFVGASLLHVVSSASVGIFMAYTFYRSPLARRIYTLLGLVVASTLHTLFNLSIMNTSGGSSLFTFYGVWIGVVVMMLIIEDIKNRHTLQAAASHPPPNITL
jgi:RsiW-degrading membrane proteinase PrsW (M82 family)